MRCEGPTMFDHDPNAIDAVSRRSVLKMTGGLLAGSTMSGLVTAEQSAAASEKTIRCGQRKVGFISGDEPEKEGIRGTVRPTDAYTVELDERTSITARLEGDGPGNDKGRGNKGGQGHGRGQDTSNDLLLALYDDAGRLISFIATANSGESEEITQTLDSGTYELRVQYSPIGDDANETFKYQLSLTCKAP